ncbi:hypothetical protein ACFL3C_05645 [Patescibacteria group bacterium]
MAEELAMARGSKITDEEFLAQAESFAKAIEDNPEEVERAEMYIGGSHLNEHEISFDVLTEQYKRIAAVPSVHEIVIEARITDLTPEKLDALDQLANETNTICTIAVGIETTNEEILADLNKGITQGSIEHGIQEILSHPHLAAQTYLLTKPTVMSEGAAIDQSLEDIRLLHEIAKPLAGSKNRFSINMAPVAAIEGTGAALNDAYVPPSLWSLIEIIRRLKEQDDGTLDNITLFFGLNTEGANVVKEGHSCPSCKEDLLAIINEFNATNDPACLENIPDCECEEEWRHQMESNRNTPIGGSIHYPYDSGNPTSSTLYNKQLRRIMELEEGRFDPEAQRDQEVRIKATDGKYHTVAYHQETGRIIAASIMGVISSADLEKIPADQRGWDNLESIPGSQDGDILRGISMASESAGGAAATIDPFLFDAVDKSENLKGIIGAAMLPGLSKVKERLEQELGEEIDTEIMYEVANQYVEGHAQHVLEGSKESIKITFTLKGKEISLDCPIDSNLGFWLKMPFSDFGPVVHSMETDEKSCNLGLTMFYERGRRGARRIQLITSALTTKTLEP